VIYTGIGSRETPLDIYQMMISAGVMLAQVGYTLRSGGAPGADMAFEQGCDMVGGLKEIFLPWKGFNNHYKSGIVLAPQIALEAQSIAEHFHPAWDRCSLAAKNLHSRNVAQILGADLNTPTDFVLCWTRDGKASGGTGQAIRIAQHYDIPIYNFHNESDLADLFQPFQI
jgi:hypothetical protein